MKKQKVEFSVGSQVKLKAGVKKIKVNDFDSYPSEYYFDSNDIATVVCTDSARLRHKPGFPDSQAVVKFSKLGVFHLIARVEISDLVAVQYPQKDL